LFTLGELAAEECLGELWFAGTSGEALRLLLFELLESLEPPPAEEQNLRFEVPINKK